MDYRASKAWHYSHNLALEVHDLVREVVESDKVALELAAKLRRASARASDRLADSAKKELLREKLQCYRESQKALEELHNHLEFALDLRYIERKFFKKLERMAITTYRELDSLIGSTQQSIAQLE